MKPCVHKSFDELRYYGVSEDAWAYHRMYVKNKSEPLCLPMMSALFTLYNRDDLASQLDAIIAACLTSSDKRDVHLVVNDNGHPWHPSYPDAPPTQERTSP